MKINDSQGITHDVNAEYLRRVNSKAAVQEQRASYERKRADNAGDVVKISGRSREVQKARRVIEASSDVRKEKVASIKEAIQKGTYKVRSEEVANRLIKETLNSIL